MRARGTIGVLGAGSWGTALAAHLAAAGHPVALWARRPELAAELAGRRVNADYLPGIELPPSLEPTSELAALADCEVVLVVVPSHGFRQVVREFLQLLPAAARPVLVSATKGVETDTLARMSEVVAAEGEAAGRAVRFAVLSGPSFAAELAAGVPTAAVIAAREPELAATLREALATASLRLYSSQDVVGVELGGTAKNVVAIAAGIIHGLGLGHNTLALTITRGLHEITRLGRAYGGKERTLSGLTGLGDLVLTCTGGLSRNRRLGVELARGRTLEEITAATTMVAEGVRNTEAIHRLAGAAEIEMPITAAMYDVLYGGKTPRQVLKELMARELKDEATL